MAQLGYTFYAKDWFTSNTRKRLKRFPLVRYAIRELIDLMNIEGGPIEMNKDYLLDDLDIDLNDSEYEKLMQYIQVEPDGRWWLNSIKKRISKAEAARENGKKGGRPAKQKKPSNQTENSGNSKTQKPSKTTQAQNPKNPPSERERERERESKSKREREETRATEILLIEKQSEFETFQMQNKKQVKDWDNLIENFNDKMDLELAQNKIDFESNQIMPRLKSYTRSWIKNQAHEKNSQFTPSPTHRPERY